MRAVRAPRAFSFAHRALRGCSGRQAVSPALRTTRPLLGSYDPGMALPNAIEGLCNSTSRRFDRPQSHPIGRPRSDGETYPSRFAAEDRMADTAGHRRVNHSEAGELEAQSLHTPSHGIIYGPLQPLAVLGNERSTAGNDRRALDTTALQLQ